MIPLSLFLTPLHPFQTSCQESTMVLIDVECSAGRSSQPVVHSTVISFCHIFSNSLAASWVSSWSRATKSFPRIITFCPHWCIRASVFQECIPPVDNLSHTLTSWAVLVPRGIGCHGESRRFTSDCSFQDTANRSTQLQITLCVETRMLRLPRILSRRVSSYVQQVLQSTLRLLHLIIVILGSVG